MWRRYYTQSIMLCLTMVNSIEARHCGGESDIHSASNAHFHRCNDAPPREPYQQASEAPPAPHDPQPHPVTSKPGSPESPKSGRRNKCCPYDFDSRLCKVVHDRVLCGYDKNRGRPQQHDHDEQLSHGCRIRNGRLECGYQHAPYTNPRRPPPHDSVVPDLKDSGSADDGFLEDNTNDNHVQSVETFGFDKLPLKLTEKPRMIVTTAKRKYPVTRCVEIGERIVCRGVV